jgi:hypothetical protein
MKISIGKNKSQEHLESRDLNFRDMFLTQIRADIKRSGEKMECAATQIGVDHSTVSYWQHGRFDMPAYRLSAWSGVYGLGALELIARQCGCALIPADTVVFNERDFKTLIQCFFQHANNFIQSALNGENTCVLTGLRYKANRIVEAINAFESGEV